MRFSTTLKVLLAISFWGASFIATKVSLRELFPLTVIVLRSTLGLAVMVTVVLWRRQTARVNSRDLGWLALLGFIGITFHQLLQAFALKTTTAINTGWIIALIPIFTAILAWLILKEHFGARKTLGIAIATLGALIVITRGNLHQLPWKYASIGDGLILVSAIIWALFTILSKRVIDRYPPTVFITYIMALGWLMLLPLFIIQSGWRSILNLSTSGWASIIFLGVACSGLAYIFWYDALAESEASKVASFLYIEPIITVLVASSLIGEQVTWPSMVGGAIILLGVWMVNRK